MNLQYSNQEFSDLFNLEKIGFTNLKHFEDGLGFSAIQKVPNTGLMSLIKVGVKKETKEGRAPLFITISLVKDDCNENGYLQYHDEDLNPLSTLPISLKSDEDYFISNGTFEREDGSTIDTESIIREVYDLHLKRTKGIVSIPLRFKLMFNFILRSYNEALYNRTKCLLEYLTNKQFVYPYYPDLYLDSSYHMSKSLHKKEGEGRGEEIDFYKYKVLKSTLFLYSFFSLISLYIFPHYNYYPEFLTVISKHPLTTALYVILSLYLFEIIAEEFIPKILKKDLDRIYKRIQKNIYINF